MNKNILLLVALAPLAYSLFNTYKDKDVQAKLCSTASKAEQKLKEFFDSAYDQLKITEEQAEDIYEILSTKTTGVVNRVKKLLNEEQLKIYETYLRK